MNDVAILSGKHAVVFGAAGTIGAAAAREFAAAGAEVFLSGRTLSTVGAVAKHITTNGGKAHAAEVDTLDEGAVARYIDDVANKTGTIDIVLDVAGPLAKEYGNTKLAV